MDKRHVDAIYSELLDLPAEQRRTRLDVLCAGDTALKNEVEALLAAAALPLAGVDTELEAFRNDYWRAVAGDDPDADTEVLSGHRIGIWRLEEQVGRGGLATVYRAERADGEFSQRAAFKVMRRGLDTDDLIARFRAEREILAGLDHPGIAGILDGGSMPDGRPYLVLEFVDGARITDYVVENGLSVRDCLNLLRQVAAALQHAHQHLVVHRDVKPSNVMVTNEGAVRLLDFGIAKILDPSTSAIAVRLTRTGVSMLTPAYGSPELLAGLPITTASDVYQLGLLMAEVLTGKGPIVSAGEVPAPDLTGLRDRDLVAIVQKATRREVEARYASAREFEADLDRYLSDRPVVARPDSWWYRAGKFAKRRPLLLPAAGAFLITVAVYIVTITSYSRQVAQERTIAEKTQAFMIGLFQSPDPRAPADPERGRAITVVEALDIGTERILPELADQPALQASLSRAIASVYEALDQYGPAIELRTLALEREEALYGRDSPLTLESMRTLARLNREAGNMTRAAELTDRQLDIARAMPSPGTELGLAEHAAGVHAAETGKDEEAAQLLESAIDDLLSQDGASTQLDATKLQSIITEAAAQGTTLDAVRRAESLALSALGPDTVQGLIARVQVASTLTTLGEYEEAEVRYLETLPLLERQLGPRHPDVLSTQNNLGILYGAWQRYAEAEAIHADLLQRNLEIFGPVSRAAGDSYQNLATAVARQDRYDEAITLHRHAFDTYAQVFGEPHHTTALPLLSTAYIQLLQHDEQAEVTAQDALVRLRRALPDSPLVGIAECLVATSREQQGVDVDPELLADARRLMSRGKVPSPYAELCGVATSG